MFGTTILTGAGLSLDPATKEAAVYVRRRVAVAYWCSGVWETESLESPTSMT